MRKTILNFLVCLGIQMAAGAISAAEITWEELAAGYQNIQTVLVDDQKSRNLYFGSSQGVFSSVDSGKTWRNMFSLKGENRQVHALVYKTGDKPLIYAATANGLFTSFDQGGTWKRIFQGKNSWEKDCRVLAVIDENIYLGTKAGLFVSFDAGRNWKKQPGELGYSRILAIAFSKSKDAVIYAACVEGLFRTQNNARSWDKVFKANSSEIYPLEEEESPDSDQEEKFSAVRSVAIDKMNNNLVYLATSSGIFQSQDQGRSWLKLTDQGLRKKEVKLIGVSPNSEFYCASGNRIYLFRETGWQELSVRFVSAEINSFTWDSSAILYVASGKGLFKSDSKVFTGERELSNNRENDFLNNASPIAEVQLAAMRFAEVEPEKIKNWRKLAAKKAWFPKMSLGANRDVTDLWHWESGSTTKDCDDNLRKGRDSVDWNINFSWDLGNIVWSDDQNSIDVRSRLTVQLRNDILDEVTKLYFERLRVKSELLNLNIGDKKKREEKELRLLELNAYLDGFTGGYFSRMLKGSSG